MKIEAIFSEDLKNLLKHKLIEMVKDSGQKLTSDEAEHLINRMMYLIRQKFPSTDWESIAEAWDNGILGQYGLSKQITVSNLLSWIYKIKSTQIENNKITHDIESQYSPVWCESFNTPTVDFIAWATAKMICLEYVDPDWNPIERRQVSPRIKSLSDEYHFAAKANHLHSFENRLRNESQNYRHEYEAI